MSAPHKVRSRAQILVVALAALCFAAISSSARTPDSLNGYSGPGRYEIECVASGKALDMNLRDGRTVRQWEALHRRNQQWDIEDAGYGYVFIKSAETGGLLDLEGGGAREGGTIILTRPSGTDSQLWRLGNGGDGYVTIVSRLGKGLDLIDGKHENGVLLSLNVPSSHRNQKFRFVRISGPVATRPGIPERGPAVTDQRSSYHLGFSLGVEDSKAQLRRTYARHRGEYSPQWEEAFIEGYYDGYDSGRADNSGSFRPMEKGNYDGGFRLGQQDNRDGKRSDYTRYSDRYDARSEPFFRRGYEDGYYSAR